MDPSFYKVVAFISFITLGWCLRKFNVLKPEAFQAISGLVMFVTLPCTTITGLNGTTIGGEMALIALLGFLANIAFLIVAFLWTMRAADKDERDFAGSIPAASRSDLLQCPMFRRFSRRADW